MEFHNKSWGLKISNNGYFHIWSCEEDNGVFIIVLFNGSIWNMKIHQHWLNRATVFSWTRFQTREQEYFSHKEWGTQGYCSASAVCILSWVLHAFLGYIIIVVWFFLRKGMSIFFSSSQWAQFIKPHIYKVVSGKASIFNVFGRCHCHIAIPTSV